MKTGTRLKNIGAWACVVSTAIASSGCGSGAAGRPPLYSATGRIVVDGEIGKGVRLRLHPLEPVTGADPLEPTALANDQGEFRVGTFDEGDGAPAGKYRATLFWPDPPEGETRPVDLLGGKYSRPDSSPFRFEIVAGTNDLGTLEVSKSGIPKKNAPGARTKQGGSARVSPDGPVSN